MDPLTPIASWTHPSSEPGSASAEPSHTSLRQRSGMSHEVDDSSELVAAATALPPVPVFENQQTIGTDDWSGLRCFADESMGHHLPKDPCV